MGRDIKELLVFKDKGELVVSPQLGWTGRERLVLVLVC